MKKPIALIMVLILCLSLCARNDETDNTKVEANGSKIEFDNYVCSGKESEYIQNNKTSSDGISNALYPWISGIVGGTSNSSSSAETQVENVTSEMKNALKSAQSYLSVMPFSYSGLIEQLEYEGYSNSEATYAAENCGADWYEQAVKSAKQYLEVMAFSRSGLIDQLEYEGYTHDQAVYGVDKAY